MKIFYMCNNWVGWQVLKYLRERGEDIVGVALHPKRTAKFIAKILEEVHPAPYFYDSKLDVDIVAAFKPDIGISVFYGYILKPELIEIFPQGIINLHPAYLPYNRGANPNIWSIVDGTPAGVTLHYIDEGIDTGDIIAQSQVCKALTDTGETLYRKLEQESVDLFKAAWPLFDTLGAHSQNESFASQHYRKDVEKIRRIYLDRTYVAKELIDILRALTFPPYGGAYFVQNGRKVFMRLELYNEEGY